MRNHAKASSAGSSMRQGNRLGRIVRGAFAGRGVLSCNEGSSALAGRRFAVLSTLTAITCLMAVLAPGAGASGFHPFVETFGSAAQPSFGNRQGMAIDQATGDVYVLDSESPASIKRYNADGTPDDFSALGTNAIDGKEGADATPQNGLGFASIFEKQIAIDNSGGATDGDIYVTQSFPNVINVFSSAGAYLGQLSAAGTTDFTEACGVAVDSAGAVYVGDYGSGIHKFVPAANPPVNADHTATFTTTTNPCTLAAGAGPSAGFLFAAQFNGPISKIDSSTGEAKYSFSSETTTVTVDPGTGRVYALKGSSFLAFDASSAGSATLLSTDALTGNGFGIAVRGSNGHVHVADSAFSKLQVFGPMLFAPTVAIAPASGIASTEATLNGTVDPEGVALSECKFEWGPKSGSGYPNSVPCEQSLPADSNVHSVSADISGLVGEGAQYRFRLVATNANASRTSDPETFRVGATINGTAASTGVEEATLRGSIVPSGGETDYRFEWGPTNAYGNTTPLASLPSGEEPVAISAVLVGLDPGATYHYRLVAENDTDTTEGPDRTFTTSAGPPQFPQRAYELVSFYPTGGIPFGFLSSASEDGDRAQIATYQPLPGSEMVVPPDHEHNGAAAWRYGSVRTADGWKFYETGLAQRLAAAGTSADGKRYTFSTTSNVSGDPRLDPDDQNGGPFNQANEDIYQRQPDGTLVWITRDPRIPVGTPQTAVGDTTMVAPAVANMSVDGRTVVFSSQRQLSDDDTTPNSGDNGTFRLYKWSDGELSFIGKRPDGSVPVRGSGLGTGVAAGWSPQPNSNPGVLGAVSRDGTRVVFSAYRNDLGESGNGGTIYIQIDGQPTVEAVKETGVPPLPANQPFQPIYRGASADVSRVFFTTSSRLTPDSGASARAPLGLDSGNADLYVYDTDADKVRDLTPRLDGIDDPTVDPALEDRGRVQGVAANSEDGKRVYFVADAQYDVAPNPEGELPSSEGRNLYMAELDGIDDPIELRFIGALGTTDRDAWDSYPFSGGGKTAYASPDGSVLSFGSEQPLTGQALGGTEQLFVYDAEADTLKCASCPPDGSLPTGNVNQKTSFAGGFEAGQNWLSAEYDRRWVSADGTVFFHTASPLVSEDDNGVADVYEYRAGEPHLVSTGTSTNPTLLESVSRDGSTVFVKTPNTFLSWDEEPGVPKLYAARTGGGFPVPSSTPACDLGAGACEGSGTSAPDIPGAGSAAFQGPGDPTQSTTKRCPKGKRKVRRQGKVRCVRPKARKQGHKRTAKHDRRASR